MKVVAANKKALFNYEVLKEFEAGIILKGWEVKSAKAGTVSLKESYITLQNGGAWLIGAHFSKWPGMPKSELGNEVIDRKLLLNRQELDKLNQAKSERGNTIIPIDLHLQNKKVKVKIAVARGRKQYDKRQKLKEKDIKKQIQQDLTKI